ncbi:hypothetical protein XCR1_2290001 [Xenorhabdus cabanillasii JM26]|uniref:Uncharacterized protein n=1 Tax=Xenorhabdus cabanillasii JM26 TaxID=1427517 RepID=W1J4A8_9GAMM|nr:hypothetical protein XCR1_2290001 [Xenorhabdus cabanillasii JM26]
MAVRASRYQALSSKTRYLRHAVKAIGPVCPDYSVISDLLARKPIGWAMSFSPDSELTKKASKDTKTAVFLSCDRSHHSIIRRFSDARPTFPE